MAVQAATFMARRQPVELVRAVDRPALLDAEHG
jgi:hypothetical protein